MILNGAPFVLLMITLCIRIDVLIAQDVSLWPPIEPYRTGHLEVSDLHELYFELSGNPEGIPVIGLHGGPGGSSSPYMRRFFNPEKFHIILYDQRGSGKSKPYAEVRGNTTQDLVEDINRLRLHLKLDKVILFGGSWGSTLGLAYAEKYPEHVAGLVLRGIFLATKEEIDHFYHGGVEKFFPETYRKLLDSLPDQKRHPLPRYLLKLIQSEDQHVRERAIRAWAGYEIKISGLFLPDADVETIVRQIDATAFSLLENHYMANACFLEEGQLLRDAERIRNIPLVMVNGRYDVICPPITAYRLHQRLPGSKLIIAENAGHWMGEKPIEKALLEAMKGFE